MEGVVAIAGTIPLRSPPLDGIRDGRTGPPLGEVDQRRRPSVECCLAHLCWRSANRMLGLSGDGVARPRTVYVAVNISADNVPPGSGDDAAGASPSQTTGRGDCCDLPPGNTD